MAKNDKIFKFHEFPFVFLAAWLSDSWIKCEFLFNVTEHDLNNSTRPVSGENWRCGKEIPSWFRHLRFVELLLQFQLPFETINQFPLHSWSWGALQMSNAFIPNKAASYSYESRSIKEDTNRVGERFCKLNRAFASWRWEIAQNASPPYSPAHHADSSNPQKVRKSKSRKPESSLHSSLHVDIAVSTCPTKRSAFISYAWKLFMIP